MRNIVISGILTALSGPALANGPQERCEQIKTAVAVQGLKVDMVLEAVELFDANNRSEHPLSFVLHLDPLSKPCDVVKGVDPLFDYFGFILANDATIEIGSRFYAGAILGQMVIASSRTITNPPVWQPVTQFLGDTKVQAYHAVMAAMMKQVGFDTWESASGSTFSTLTDLRTEQLPFTYLGREVLGVAGKGDKMYQIRLKQYAVGFNDR